MINCDYCVSLRDKWFRQTILKLNDCPNRASIPHSSVHLLQVGRRLFRKTIYPRGPRIINWKLKQIQSECLYQSRSIAEKSELIVVNFFYSLEPAFKRHSILYHNREQLNWTDICGITSDNITQSSLYSRGAAHVLTMTDRGRPSKGAPSVKEIQGLLM